jgi:gliding motility-associated protein GldM
MAGGKQSPRDKMIGMMYLVLTALLALQVSNAVLEKFATINVALEELASQTNAKNAEELTRIADASKTSKSDTVQLAYANAQKIRDLTKATIAKTAAVKKDFLDISGTDKIDGKFINDHSSKVAYAMISPTSTKGPAYEKVLTDYRTELESLSMGLKFNTLARAPKDIPEFKDDKDHIRKSFLEFTFENTPPIAAYASVTEMESQIYAYESQALAHLAGLADAKQLKFDDIFPFVKPQQSIVVAGSKYEAEMYIGASNSGLNPVMYKDGVSLPIEVNQHKIKYGKVSFTAPAGGYDPKTGIAQKKFIAKIEVKGQVFEEEVPYGVIAPTVKITSGALSKLYINCGNELNVEVPGLGTNFVPGYNAGAEAEVIKGAKVGQITVVPKSKAKVKLAVSNSGSPIETVTFDVRTAPPPSIEVSAAGKQLNAKDGVSKNSLGQIKIKAVADDDFANTVPKDAEFRIRKGRVYLRKGTQLGQPVEFQGESMNLSTFMAMAKPGDVLSIELESVTRRTFKGENEPVTLSNNIKYISIPIGN